MDDFSSLNAQKKTKRRQNPEQPYGKEPYPEPPAHTRKFLSKQVPFDRNLTAGLQDAVFFINKNDSLPPVFVPSCPLLFSFFPDNFIRCFSA